MSLLQLLLPLQLALMHALLALRLLGCRHLLPSHQPPLLLLLSFPPYRSLGLLRCNKVGDTGLGDVAHYCRRLEALTLHHCPEVSDAALVEVRLHSVFCGILEIYLNVSAQRHTATNQLSLSSNASG